MRQEFTKVPWATHIKVRSIWLVLPIYLSISTAVFLMISVVSSSFSKATLWKSSISVWFYHGLNFDISLHDSLLGTIPEMKTQSSMIRARLLPYGRNDRLVMTTSVHKRGSCCMANRGTLPAAGHLASQPNSGLEQRWTQECTTMCISG